MDPFKLHLCTSYSEIKSAARLDHPLCHMVYRIGTGFRLYRNGLDANVRGGTMLLSDYGLSPEAAYSGSLIKEVQRECENRGYKGIVCDFENHASPSLRRFAYEAADALTGSGIALYVPEAYAQDIQNTRVLISSSVKNGSFHEAMSNAVRLYGKRCAMIYEPLCTDLAMSSADGDHRLLSKIELRKLMAEQNAVSYFSRELCAAYFTYRNEQKKSRFVLFDDARSLVKKLAAILEAGFEEAFFLYADYALHQQEIQAILEARNNTKA